MIQKTASVTAIMAIALCTSKPASTEINVTIEEPSQSTGCQEEDHLTPLWGFLSTGPDRKPQDWQNFCALTASQTRTRIFFEVFFHPDSMKFFTLEMFIGYFEPELDRALQPSKWFQYPTYKTPPDLPKGQLWLTRRQTEAGNALASLGLGIESVTEPVEVCFLQIQGSARVLSLGRQAICFGYGIFKGHSYKSLGVELVQCGRYDQYLFLAQTIQNWVQHYSIVSQKLLRHCSGYMCFWGIPDFLVHKGPLADMKWSLTSMRSFAVDPKFVPQVAPVWLEVGWSGVKIKDRSGMLVMLTIQRAFATLLEQGR